MGEFQPLTPKQPQNISIEEFAFILQEIERVLTEKLQPVYGVAVSEAMLELYGSKLMGREVAYGVRQRCGPR